MGALFLFPLAVLAGAFIGFGAMFSTAVSAGVGERLHGFESKIHDA